MLKEEIKKLIFKYSLISGITMPTIKYFSKGATAGRAEYRSHTVFFNEVLAVENKVIFVNTVIHEIAHLAVRKKYGKVKPHGKEWKEMMIFLGAKPNRCHTYNVINVKKKYFMFEYNCSCGIHNLTSIKHNRITKGSIYTCKRCKKELLYIKDLGKMLL